MSWLKFLSVWDAGAIERTIGGAIFSGGVGYLVWLLQRRSTVARAKIAEEKAEILARAARLERENAERAESERLDLVRRVKDMEVVLTDFKERIALMDQTVRPLFEAAKLKLIEVLTHPAPEFKIPDGLLDKVKDPAGHITAKEMEELERLLKERESSTHPDVTPEEKLAAAILPTVIKLAAIEAAATEPLTLLQVVSSPAKPELQQEEKS